MLSSSNPEKLYTKNSEIFTPRWGHTVILYQDTIIIYGGFCKRSNEDYYYNDIIKLDLLSMTFSRICTDITPPRRSNHSAILYNDQMIIHAGKDGISYYNETYSFNLLTNELTKLETSDNMLVDRAYHTANVYKDYMIVFGGEISNQILDDLWVLDLTSKKWYNINLPNGIGLEPRSFHCAEFIGDQMYLVGGYFLEMKCVIPITIIDFKNYSPDYPCLLVNRVKTFLPIPRWGCLMKQSNNNLYLFGGRNNDDDSNKLTVFMDNRWKEIRFKNNIIPPTRRSNGIIYKGCFIILGGLYKETFSNDAYIINLNTLIDSQEVTNELFNYINNRDFADITIVNGKKVFYAHSVLLFSRISCIDIPRNTDISDLKNKKTSILDLSSYRLDDRVILNLLELLYLGKFTSIKYENELYEIYTLLANMHLSNTRDKIKQFALYNYPKQYPTDSTDMRKFQTNNILLNPKLGHTILRLNHTLDVAGFYYKYNHYHIEDMLMYRNKPLFLHRNYIEELLTFIPQSALDAILYYTMNNELKNITAEDLVTVVELLFFADYFCFYSLIQVCNFKLRN
jgi:hypothetical protein